MSFQLLSRRSVFGRLFGAAALLIGAGRSAAAASIAQPLDTARREGVTYYCYDECGRVIRIDEWSPPCDASPAAQPPSGITSWSYDDVLGD